MDQVFFNVPLAKLEPIFKKWIKEVHIELQLIQKDSSTTVTSNKTNSSIGQNHSIIQRNDKVIAPSESLEEQTIKTPVYEIWWFQYLFTALLTGLWGGVFSWWFSLCHPFSGFLVISSLVAVILFYFGNPERRFFRAANSLSAASLLFLKISFSLQWTNKDIEGGNFHFFIEQSNEYEGLILLALICLSFFLYFIDYKRQNSK